MPKRLTTFRMLRNGKEARNRLDYAVETGLTGGATASDTATQTSPRKLLPTKAKEGQSHLRKKR